MFSGVYRISIIDLNHIFLLFFSQKMNGVGQVTKKSHFCIKNFPSELTTVDLPVLTYFFNKK
ncbi:hypothetical protein KOSB73_40150 [Klebsiella grimontii]|uniref:Uncharacterized protein n=1 Tax=Klebsiella grimontii TaxID=2058152 RepID=A0A285B9F1_9ENTR|nr:hypothetical protein KOSB73_40150 [Klebsiella grimontii]